MKYETKILSTRYPRPDAYGSLAMPVYHTAAFEFPSAKAMSDAFCGRSAAPSYSRIANPTVSHLEERVRQWTGALSVTALNTGMAAVAYALTAVSAAGLNIVASRHLFGNSLSLLRDTLGTLGVEARFADFTCPDEVAALTDDNTAALFFEVITNPQLLVADIRARPTATTSASTSRSSAALSISLAAERASVDCLSTMAQLTGRAIPRLRCRAAYARWDARCRSPHA